MPKRIKEVRGSGYRKPLAVRKQLRSDAEVRRFVYNNLPMAPSSKWTILFTRKRGGRVLNPIVGKKYSVIGTHKYWEGVLVERRVRRRPLRRKWTEGTPYVNRGDLKYSVVVRCDDGYVRRVESDRLVTHKIDHKKAKKAKKA